MSILPVKQRELDALPPSCFNPMSTSLTYKVKGMHRTFPESLLALKLYIYSVGLFINQLKMGCMVYTKMVVVLSSKQNMGDF